MRITDVRVTPIAIADPPLRNAAGLHAPYALRTIVEIIDDHGTYGLSEIPGNKAVNEALVEAREVLVGQDPFQLNHIMQKLQAHFGQNAADDRGESPWDQRRLVHIFSAVEVACLDLIGKTIDRPVVDLLGGRCRDRVPFSAYLFLKHEGAGGPLEFATDPAAQGWAAARQAEALTPDGIVEQAQAMCKEFGFQSIKLKGGTLDPDIEVGCILALREAFGADTPLRLDPNAVWKVETAIKWGQKMEGILEYYEDPTRGQENMAKVGQALSMPLATNMCTTSFDDLAGSVRWGSEDIILVDHHYWGGLRASVELGRICSTFGRGLSMHSNSHVGISLAAMTHLAAAVPNLTYAVDTHYPWQSDEVIVGGRLKIEGGSLAIPDGPGLGVELDREALARLHQTYLECGLTHRDDQIEMQKVEPGWT
ncbi:MAG: enolase C-terminal domain-like protein, partial [Candidatus Latescibacterota bacterium]